MARSGWFAIWRVSRAVICVALLATGTGVVVPGGTPGLGADNGHDERSDSAPRVRYELQSGYGLDQISCAPPGEKQFWAIYARPSDMTEDRYPQVAPALRSAIRGASGNLNAEAQGLSTMVGARLKVKCGDSSDVYVTPVVLPTSRADSTRDTVTNDLRHLGYDDPYHKYLVFFEGCRRQPETKQNCGGGQVGRGTIDNDASPTGANPNNSGPDYAIIWCGCSDVGPSAPYGTPTLPSPTGGTILHEALHTLGAVQPSAPRGTGGHHHCYQYSDIMCYDDGGPNAGRYGDNSDCLHWTAVDCGNDDYFHPHPAPGSYLESHWNIAAAYVEFIDHAPTPDVSPPFRTVDLTATRIGEDTVELQWTPALDKRGVTAIEVRRRSPNETWAVVAPSTENDGSFRATGLSPDTTYEFAITATDEAGNASGPTTVEAPAVPR